MKNILSIKIYILCFLVTGWHISSAQSVVNLDQVLSAVIDDSYSAVNAKNQKEIADANYKFYKSLLKPNVSLSANIPNYSKTFSPVVQPDGTITFTSIRQANSSISLFATQVLPATGGTLFLNSDIQRFDDLSLDTKQYNGNPIRLGINQPLFGFNPWKYQKDIQSFTKEASILEYNIRIEEAQGQATDLYFNILIAKQNLEIANTNELVNEKLLTITEERLLLGKVSQDEKLQLEIEYNNAKLSVSQAGFEVEQAIANLYTFLGQLAPGDDTEFLVPGIGQDRLLDIEILIKESKTNRPEVLAYQKEKSQTKMDLAEAKANFGIQADVQASIGLARGAEQFKEVYSDPFNEQQFNISLLVPILDWGKRKSAMRQIEIRENDIEASYEQQFLVLENSIRQKANLFSRLQSQIKLLKEIMEKADERFSISNERYVLGNIDITNLTLAQREKDQTKRNYINALKSYWVTYYELRALSGYDLLNDQEIIYQ